MVLLAAMASATGTAETVKDMTIAQYAIKLSRMAMIEE
jgi:hypothetical protein